MQFEMLKSNSAMASDTGGLASQETTRDSQLNSQQTYANATAKQILPIKEQAIILDSIEGISIDNYIDGLEKVIDLNQIRYISKISGRRVCIYLSNVDLVEKLTNKFVTVKEIKLKIRPLMEKNKRVVISNVSPHIPNEILQDYFRKMDIQLVSQISQIRASLSKPGRSHILSFRRQVYVKEADEHRIPESIQIFHDETPSWIYFSTDSTCCYICKQKVTWPGCAQM